MASPNLPSKVPDRSIVSASLLFVAAAVVLIAAFWGFSGYRVIPGEAVPVSAPADGKAVPTPSPAATPPTTSKPQ